MIEVTLLIPKSESLTLLFKVLDLLSVPFFSLSFFFFLPFPYRVQEHNFILFQGPKLISYNECINKWVSIDGKEKTTKFSFFLPFLLFCYLKNRIVDRGVDGKERDTPYLQRVSTHRSLRPRAKSEYEKFEGNF
jgi:hypothetical protein